MGLPGSVTPAIGATEERAMMSSVSSPKRLTRVFDASVGLFLTIQHWPPSRRRRGRR